MKISVHFYTNNKKLDGHIGVKTINLLLGIVWPFFYACVCS